MEQPDADAAPPTNDADAGPSNVEDADSGQPISDASDGGDVVTAVEAGPDASDAAPEAAPEAAADAAPDVVDASAMYAFPGQVVTAICKQIAACCYGDAGTPYSPVCTSDNALGLQGSNQGAQFLDGGHVVFDAVKAQKCLADIAAIDCRTDQITTADYLAARPDCFGALQGTLPVGSTCNDSIECAPGETCARADGGAGLTCQQIRLPGAGCGDFGTPANPTSAQVFSAESICSYRGSGNTAVVCEYEDRATGNPLPDGGWTCVAAGAAGTNCSYNLDCTSLVCPSSTFTCGMAAPFVTTFGCNRYKADGG